MGVGTDVGVEVGTLVGAPVGDSVGELGRFVGLEVGDLLGLGVGTLVGGGHVGLVHICCSRRWGQAVPLCCISTDTSSLRDL